MGFISTFLVIIGAYFLGFLTAAMLRSGKKADEWADGYRAGRDENDI